MTPYSFTPFSMRLPRRLITADRPLVMAILNATPDSFYAASRADGADAIARRAERLIADGADVIDLGAYSSDMPPSCAARATARKCLPPK